MPMNWYSNFFQLGPIHGTVMYGHYDLSLVILSYVIASLASYVALDMSAHLRKPTTPLFRLGWLVGGSFVMGSGIWSMHFIGMLAFIMPMQMTYSFFWTGLSMLVAVLTAFTAFLLFTIKNPKTKHYLLIGVILGAAIPTMHYTGMAGMDNVIIRYQVGLFGLSILIAIIAATAALWLAVKSDHGSFAERARLKLVSALIMGFAIVGMHYTGMFAAVFYHSESMSRVASIDPTLLAVSIGSIVISILLIALLFSTAKYTIDSKLKNKNDLLGAILDNMGGGVIACDAKGKITMVNLTVAKMWGAMANTNLFLNQWEKKFPFFKAEHDQKIEFNEHPLYRALKGENIKDVEVKVRDRKGNTHILSVDGQQLKSTENENLGAVIVFNDISRRKKDEEALKHQAAHDILTGLPNRNLLLDRLEQSIAMAERHNLKVTVIFVDLDYFKFINDALGHSIGDILLKMVTARFTHLLRSMDTLARIGGDEFVIILPDQENINHVPNLLERILHSISQPYFVDGHELNVTCSMGFSVYPENGQDVETLLKNADNAMYQAKENGRNTFQFFNTSMQTQVRKRLEMENDLRHAVTNNEFILEYQPKLDIKENKLVGVEALVRWQRPNYGLVPPNEFIPIAEETGLIIPIGQWVLRTACMQNKAWQDAGLTPVTISVNLSSRQCKEKDLFKSIKKTLDETGLAPEYLELELTESLAMSDPREFIEILTKFRELGIKTSIDDFGTGYSSLNYLRQFPVDCLKIDQTFIQELEKKGGDVSIVKAIVSLGHSLNMKVIAEGVETKYQLSELEKNDCDEIQGYYLSTPISAEDVFTFIKDYH